VYNEYAFSTSSGLYFATITNEGKHQIKENLEESYLHDDQVLSIFEYHP
jgi:hypothetical protein